MHILLSLAEPGLQEPVIIEQCRQVFESALYSSLAVPEVRKMYNYRKLCLDSLFH